MVKIFNSNAATPSKPTPNIIVVGGGLAGLSTCLGLAKLGYQVDLIEYRIEWLQQGSAFGLAANGRKALKELFQSPSSLDALLGKGIYTEGLDSYLMLWYMIRDALLEEVNQSSLIRVHMGTTVESYDDTSNVSHIEVTIKDADESGRQYKLKANLLVAADGVYSNFRSLVGLEKAKYVTKTKWRGTIPHVPKDSILEQFLDKGVTPLSTDERMKGLVSGKCLLNLFNFHPKIDRKMTFVLNASVQDVPPNTHPRELFRQHKTDPYHLQILEEIYKLADDRELCFPLPMAVVELPKDGSNGWGGRGRIVFVGDAAHAMRPTSGLGGSMAFEDAVVLCRILKEDDGSALLGDRKSTEALVRKFESSRFERVNTIWENQWELSEDAYKSQGNKRALSIPWNLEFASWIREGV